MHVSPQYYEYSSDRVKALVKECRESSKDLNSLKTLLDKLEAFINAEASAAERNELEALCLIQGIISQINYLEIGVMPIIN